MTEPIDVAQDSSPETAVVEPVEVPEVVETTTTPTEPPKTEDKTVPYSRFKEVNDELARLKKEPVKVINTALDVDDYIGISASLEGLDQREKEYLAQQHKLSGKSLKDIRNSEDFGLWQTAYRTKVAKEKAALAPSSQQPEAERQKSFTDKLNSASITDKEKMLKEMGLYKEPKRRDDSVKIA